jgi:hypothetical protein
MEHTTCSVHGLGLRFAVVLLVVLSQSEPHRFLQLINFYLELANLDLQKTRKRCAQRTT